MACIGEDAWIKTDQSYITETKICRGHIGRLANGPKLRTNAKHHNNDKSRLHLNSWEWDTHLPCVTSSSRKVMHGWTFCDSVPLTKLRRLLQMHSLINSTSCVRSSLGAEYFTLEISIINCSHTVSHFTARHETNREPKINCSESKFPLWYRQENNLEKFRSC